MVAGQENPIISIVIDNNNDNDNIPLNGFQHHAISQVGAEENIHINCGLPASRSMQGSTTLYMWTTSRPWYSDQNSERSVIMGVCIEM